MHGSIPPQILVFWQTIDNFVNVVVVMKVLGCITTSLHSLPDEGSIVLLTVLIFPSHILSNTLYVGLSPIRHWQ